MAIAGCMQMLVTASGDALPNGMAIGTREAAIACARLMAMLTGIAPFFDEMFTRWRVAFLTSEPGTL
jgi:hypothetical protein